VTVQRAYVRAGKPERTCYRCDGVFRVASDDARVYCPACRCRYGFPAPSTTGSAPSTVAGVA
jgi:hypothetical protein